MPTENRQTDNQVNKQRTLNSKTEATLILCGSSGERAKRGRPSKQDSINVMSQVEILDIDTDIDLNKISEIDKDRTKKTPFIPQKTPKSTPLISSSNYLKDQNILNCLPKSTKIVFSPSVGEENSIEKKAVLPQQMICSLCKNSFPNKSSFDAHIKQFHGEVKSSIERTQAEKAKLAQKSTTNIQKVEAPQIVTKECTICKGLVRQEDMVMHMKSHRHSCGKCNFEDSNLKSLNLHMKTEHNHRCKCKLVFDSNELLSSHIRSKHTFKCLHCTEILESDSLLKLHIKNNHTFKCTYCTHVSHTSDDINEHEKSNHRRCPDCKDEFNWVEPGHSCYYTRNNIRPAVDLL